MTLDTKTISETQIKQELERISDRIKGLVQLDAVHRRQNIIALTGSVCTLERLGLIDQATVLELLAQAQACDTEHLIKEEAAASDFYGLN